MSNWYKKKTANGTYYTPFTGSKPHYTHIGDGDRMPTPKELSEFLTATRPSQDVYVDSTGYVTLYDADESAQEKVDLPSGVYIYKQATSETPERLVEMELRKDAYVDVDELTTEIKEDISDFLNNEALYREDNIIYKIGFLMYGPPGNGKTALLRQLLQHKFPEGTVTIYLYALPSVDFLSKIQNTLRDRLKIFVFEELVTVVDNMPLHVVLNFLDGEHSIDKSITFATTNHPEKLPGNLVDRPSRFDKRYKLGNPSASDRRKILEFYLKRPVEQHEIDDTKGLSVASLKEISMLVRIKKKTVLDAVRHMKAFSELVKKDFGESRKIGMNSDYDD